MSDTTIWFVVGSIALLLVIGCVRRNPLALWIVETLVMFAVFAIGKSLFGTKGYVRGYTGRPRIRKQ